MGSTVRFEMCIGALSALVALISAILLGVINSKHVFPHENRKSLAVANIVLTIVADVYLNIAIARVAKNGQSRMLSYRMRPLAHAAVMLMNLAFSLAIVISKPYNKDDEKFWFDGPDYWFPTGPVEYDCCFFFGLIGLHFFNFMAVIINRARRQDFKEAFGYDGYNDPKAQRDMELNLIDQTGQPRSAAPKRVYVV